MAAEFLTENILVTVADNGYYELESLLAYRSELYGLDLITVPIGFSTDLATVPWWAQWRVKRHGKHNLPAVVHDYLLENRDILDITRRQCAQVFREALIVRGVHPRKASLMYRAVRINDWYRDTFA